MLQPSEEIKSKLDIVEVIREYIPLKPAGINFRALCPFHREKTPSFMVSPEKQIFHCFGCGKGGDIFSFVMEMEGVSFVEALRILAQKAGVRLKRQDPKLASQRNRLLDILELATNYYHKALLESDQAESVRKYLTERELSEETISEWRIGYSLDSWDDVINLLKKKGFSENEIFLAGMSIKKEGTGRFYNRFRDRIMFPLTDINGAVAAFSARVNPASAKASAGKPGNENEFKLGKYINSPVTMVYDKSRILYGLDKARMAIKTSDLAVITEGQMDVITAHQHGYKNVIASSGTALTSEQVKLIKRYTNNIALAFDMDQAGQVAVDRGIREAMQAEMNIKVVIMPAGKDPDECIRESSEEWETAVKNAPPMMEYYFSKIFADFNLEKVEDRREAAKKILLIISNLGNNIEQDFWLKKLSEKIDVAENLLRETLNKDIKSRQLRPRASGSASEAEETKGVKQIRQSREEMLSEILLAIILKFGELVNYIIDNITIDHLAGADNKLFYKNLIIYYNNISDSQAGQGRVKIDYNEFKSWLENEFIITEDSKTHQETNSIGDSQLKLLDKLVLLGDKDFYDLDNEQAKNEVIKIIIILKKYYLMSRMKEIEKLIAQSEKEGDEGKVKELMEELKTLGDEMREVGE